MSVFQRKSVVLLLTKNQYIAQWHPRKIKATFLWHTNHCKTWYLATFGDSPSWYLPAKKPRWLEMLHVFMQNFIMIKVSSPNSHVFQRFRELVLPSIELYHRKKIVLETFVFQQPATSKPTSFFNEWKMEMVKMLRKIPTISQIRNNLGFPSSRFWGHKHLYDTQLLVRINDCWLNMSPNPLSRIPGSLKMSSVGLRGNSRLKTGGVAFASELTTWYSKQPFS